MLSPTTLCHDSYPAADITALTSTVSGRTSIKLDGSPAALVCTLPSPQEAQSVPVDGENPVRDRDIDAAGSSARVTGSCSILIDVATVLHDRGLSSVQ